MDKLIQFVQFKNYSILPNQINKLHIHIIMVNVSNIKIFLYPRFGALTQPLRIIVTCYNCNLSAADVYSPVLGLQHTFRDIAFELYILAELYSSFKTFWSKWILEQILAKIYYFPYTFVQKIKLFDFCEGTCKYDVTKAKHGLK